VVGSETMTSGQMGFEQWLIKHKGAKL
jgi:hypothetical protein